MRIQCEAFLKMQARSAQQSGQSVLNLYKNALAINFKGIWLPSDHKGLFLAKLRRIRKYELQKQRNPKPRQNHVSIVMHRRHQLHQILLPVPLLCHKDQHEAHRQ